MNICTMNIWLILSYHEPHLGEGIQNWAQLCPERKTKISLQIQILWTFIVHKYKLLKYIKVFQKWFDVEFTEIEFVRDVRWLLKHVENISEQISCDISDIH